MKNQKKTFWGGLMAIVLGASCCWMSSIALWLGGASMLGLLVEYTEAVQPILLIVGFLLVLLAYFKRYS